MDGARLGARRAGVRSASSCSSDAECDEPAHCDGGNCEMDRPNGMACDEDSDCVSAHCQNGFCCAAGDCCASGSDCPSSTYGEPSVCLDGSSCQGERRDPVCRRCITVAEGTTGSFGSLGVDRAHFDGCCSPFGCNGSGTFQIRVEGQGAPGFQCLPYRLTLSIVRTCR